MAPVEDDDPDSPMCRFYIRADEWQPGEYDEKLLALADDEIRVIWMRRDNGAVFAPYDGGFDLFPATWEDVALLKEERRDWLSDHPEGL